MARYMHPVTPAQLNGRPYLPLAGAPACKPISACAGEKFPASLAPPLEKRSRSATGQTASAGGWGMETGAAQDPAAGGGEGGGGGALSPSPSAAAEAGEAGVRGRERGAKWGKRPRSLRRAGPKGGGGEAAAPEEGILRRRVEDLLEETRAAWGAPRRAHPKHASSGRWQPCALGGGLARVHQSRGKAWRIVGIMADGAFGAEALEKGGQPGPPQVWRGGAKAGDGPGLQSGTGAEVESAAGAGEPPAKAAGEPGLLFLHPEETAFLSEQCDLVLREPGAPGRVVSVRECYALLQECGVGSERYAAYSHLKRLAYIVKRHPCVWKAPRGAAPWFFTGANWPDAEAGAAAAKKAAAAAAAAAEAAGWGRTAASAASAGSPDVTAAPQDRHRGWFPALAPGHPWLGSVDFAALPPPLPFQISRDLPPELPLRPFPALRHREAGALDGEFDFDLHCPEGSTNFARRAPPPVHARLRVEGSIARPAFEGDRWNRLARADGEARSVFAAVDGADVCYFALGSEGVPWLG